MTAREAFEAWVTRTLVELGGEAPTFERDPERPDAYFDWALQLQWEPWKAALTWRDDTAALGDSTGP